MAAAEMKEIMSNSPNARNHNPPPLVGRRIDGAVSARIKIDGREYINFFGSGYLALTTLPELKQAALETLAGSTAFCRQVPSALGAIEAEFEAVERLSAAAIGSSTSVYLASGYFIGLSGIAGMAGCFDRIFLDESAHYCLKDGARLTEVPVHTFAHCDAESLSVELHHHIQPKERPLVVTDGVFATTGRIPPLGDYAQVLAPYDGRLFIDESHGFGVVGRMGRGGAEYCGVEHLATSGATLSKALCAQGAFIGCSEEMASKMRAVPPIRGACAGSPISAAVAAASLRYVAEHPEHRQKLCDLTHYFRTRLRRAGVNVIESPAPIVSFQLGSRVDMQALQIRMLKRGIHIYHSTYVGAGEAGVIRCAVFRDHSIADIDALVEEI